MTATVAATMTAEQLEAWMVGRIATALGVRPADIDVDAPFSEHGLDSVAALALIGELEETLQRALDPTVVFDYPTIAALCRHLTS